MPMHSKVNSTYLTEKGRQLLPNKNKVHRANTELKTQIHTTEASKRGEIRKLQVTDGTTRATSKTSSHAVPNDWFLDRTAEWLSPLPRSDPAAT